MTEERYKKLRTEVDALSTSVVKALENEIRSYLDKCGIFYKIFIRIKSGQSLCEKIEMKIKEKGENYKLQDLVGVRLVVYFKEDILLCEKLISQYYHVLNISKNEDNTENFGPQRINYVCEMPEDVVRNFDQKLWEYSIDKTFEVQIRTIFSEGWHEIEHDFRYKCKEEWKNIPELARTMNGIFATLDNCDWTISSLFTQIAYHHYKAREWIPMLKNVFKMRILDYEDLEEILLYFDENSLVAKQFFRIDREEFLIKLSDMKVPCPLKMKNLIFLANLFQIHDPRIDKLTPSPLKEIM